MASAFGLFPEGFLAPTIDDLRSEMEQDWRDDFGINFPLGDSTLAGFLTGVLTERLALLWDQEQRVYDASDRDSSTGAALKALGILVGTFAPERTFSSAVLTLCGDPGTPIPALSSARTPDTLRVFSTLDDDSAPSIVALAARVSATTYAVLDRVTSNVRCYQCTVGGLSGSGGDAPSSTALDITDGEVHWTYIGEGLGAVDVVSHCDVPGPVEAAARGITEPVTPIPGVNTWTNLEDAEPGSDELSDEDFRLLIENEVAAPGTGTAAAVAADVRQITGVTYVKVFVNETEIVDSDGVGPHSFETLVQGGTDQQIRDAILANKPAGIATFGSVSGTAVDDEGKIHTIRFSRPTTLPIYVQVTLTKDPATYAGDDAVKLAVATAPSPIGQSVVAARVSAAVFSVTGLVDVPRSGSLGGVLVSLSPSPTSDATIAVTSRQLATFDTSRTSVISSDATP